VLILSLWVRSYYLEDVLTYNHRNGFQSDNGGVQYGLRSMRGLISCGKFRYSGVCAAGAWLSSENPIGFAWRSFESPQVRPVPESVWNRLGFWHDNIGRLHTVGEIVNYNNITVCSIYTIPNWTIWVFAMVFPLRQFIIRLISIRRRANGLRIGCGFDLRASSTRCPECGMPLAKKSAKRNRIGLS